MLAAFLLLAVAMAAIMSWSRRELTDFAQQHPSIADTAAFEAYKDLARSQMRWAIVYIAIGFAGLLASIDLCSTGGLPMLAVVVGVNVPLMLLGRSNKQIEDRVRALPCADPNLAGEFEHVGASWVHKALPDF
jgi:hypothetical protein